MTQSTNRPPLPIAARATRVACCRRAARTLDPEFFRALCDPTRVALLLRLAERERGANVSELALRSPVDVSVVSRHLAILRRAGVVGAERAGKEVRYRIRYATLARTLREMADAIAACCPTDSDEEENAHVHAG